MFNSVKNKISNYLAKKKYLKGSVESINFNGFFNNSDSFLLLMPNEDNDFSASLLIYNFLRQLNKKITVLVPVKFFSKVPSSKEVKIIQYSIEDISKFNLPSDVLANKLTKNKYDIVFDLERIENLFYSSLTNVTESKYKVGFKKEKLNEYYNILISNKDDRSEKCYNNMIEAIKMF